MLNPEKKLSVIAPIYNEEESLLYLHKELSQTLNKLTDNYEVILVNDGSTDKSFEILKSLAEQDQKIKVIEFTRNFGQTAALMAGIEMASGEIIVAIDADLENDPQDIPRLLEKFNEGFDVVSGWRQNRWQDKKFSRRLTSKMANWLISIVTKTKLQDYGCTLKVYRASVLKDIHLYGEMHRFIPALAAWQGAKIAEAPVNYRRRKFGQTKYGMERIIKVILDLITVKFLGSYATKPIYFFGYFGLIFIVFSIISFILAIYYKLSGLKSFVETPLPIFTVFLSVMGIFLILIGLLAELLVRIHFKINNQPHYIIKNKINF